jgi:hypothetical protein
MHTTGLGLAIRATNHTQEESAQHCVHDSAGILFQVKKIKKKKKESEVDASIANSHRIGAPFKFVPWRQTRTPRPILGY